MYEMFEVGRFCLICNTTVLEAAIKMRVAIHRLCLRTRGRTGGIVCGRAGGPSGVTTMFAPIHSRVRVDDLLRGVTVMNANDGAMALAEGLAGNERAFAALMATRAREIGLTNATFANASGLPDVANQMS